MYLEWNTSTAGQTSGFIGYWTSDPDFSAAVPVADFAVPDTIFTDREAVFTSLSTGSNLTYSWDFDPPFLQQGSYGGDEASDAYSWGSSGTYTVRLAVYRCCGGAIFDKLIQ